MQAPGIGLSANMALVDNDVAVTLLHEFVYHNIKNLGFNESNVHVHLSNGGHDDIIAIEWEIELIHYYQAADTAGYFNYLFQNENWHKHVTSWMSGVGQSNQLQAAALLVNLDEFALILPAHIDTKPQTNFDDASHSAEVQALIDEWLGSKKPATDTITLYAGCSPLSSLTFQPTDFAAQVGAAIITKSSATIFSSIMPLRWNKPTAVPSRLRLYRVLEKSSAFTCSGKTTLPNGTLFQISAAMVRTQISARPVTFSPPSLLARTRSKTQVSFRTTESLMVPL